MSNFKVGDIVFRKCDYKKMIIVDIIISDCLLIICEWYSGGHLFNNSFTVNEIIKKRSNNK